MSPAVRQKGNSVNLTVVSHPVHLAIVPRLAEIFEPGDSCGPWLLQALLHCLVRSIVLFFSFYRKLVSDEPADSHHL